MKKLVMLALVAMLALGVLTACGGDKGGGSAREITVEMGQDGKWVFNPDKVEVTKGEKVKVNLVNKDASQAHSFVITAVNAKSKQVPANATGSVEFTADKAGEFDIFCDVPGHKDAGMVGKLIVK